LFQANERGDFEDAKAQLSEKNRLVKTLRSTCDQIAAEKDAKIDLLREQLDDSSGKRLG
jgi:hypothetical protein